MALTSYKEIFREMKHHPDILYLSVSRYPNPNLGMWMYKYSSTGDKLFERYWIASTPLATCKWFTSGLSVRAYSDDNRVWPEDRWRIPEIYTGCEVELVLEFGEKF